MERLTHRRSDGSTYSDLDMQTCLNRLADYEDQSEKELKKIESNNGKRQTKQKGIGDK